jgi:hypothetical protein
MKEAGLVKRRVTSARPHGATTQKTAVFILAALRTSNPTRQFIRRYVKAVVKWVRPTVKPNTGNVICASRKSRQPWEYTQLHGLGRMNPKNGLRLQFPAETEHCLGDVTMFLFPAPSVDLHNCNVVRYPTPWLMFPLPYSHMPYLIIHYIDIRVHFVPLYHVCQSDLPEAALDFIYKANSVFCLCISMVI